MRIWRHIKYQMSIVRTVAAVTYKEWAAYRTHSMVSIIIGPLHFLVMTSIWRAVYAQGGSVGGLALDEMILYYGVSTLISYLIMDFADWNLQMLIRTGKYLTFALRPLHHRFFALSQKIGHRILGVLFEFLPVLIIMLVLFGLDFRAASWPWAVISVVLGFLMQFFINYTIGLTGFWLVKTEGLRSIVWLLTNICSGALFPLIILPRIVQGAAFFLPFQFTLYVPAMVFSGSYNLGGFQMDIPAIVAVQAGYVLLMYAFSEFLYKISIKRFTAVGV